MPIERIGENNTTIRPARPGDAESIRTLVRAAYSSYAEQVGRTPGPVKDDYERRIAAAEVWVLDRGNDIVGVVVLKEQGDGLLLDNVAVKPSAQGQGFGRMLIAFAEQEARRRGFAELRLFTNVIMVKNIALYTSLGFVQIERFQDGDTVRIQMSKSIG